ncbi:MAG: hypothetical protein CMF70_07960 [Magnetovibrio sp.]|nr:hypothetical protein [Magnetovibrio sp.]
MSYNADPRTVFSLGDWSQSFCCWELATRSRAPASFSKCKVGSGGCNYAFFLLENRTWRILKKFKRKTILSAEQVEDIIAHLMTLK